MKELKKAIFQGLSRAVVKGHWRAEFMIPEKPMISPAPNRVMAAAPPIRVPPRKPFNKDMMMRGWKSEANKSVLILFGPTKDVFGKTSSGPLGRRPIGSFFVFFRPARSNELEAPAGSEVPNYSYLPAAYGTCGVVPTTAELPKDESKTYDDFQTSPAS
eukprot:scaffold9933_cov226-Amphora_coffeaeformis.AAC.2